MTGGRARARSSFRARTLALLFVSGMVWMWGLSVPGAQGAILQNDAYDAAVLATAPSSLWGYWKFDEPMEGQCTGSPPTLHDSAPAASHPLQGYCSAGVQGRFDGALATGQWGQCANTTSCDTAPSDFTVAEWVREDPDHTGSIQPGLALLGGDTIFSNAFKLRLDNNGQVRFILPGFTTLYGPYGPRLDNGQWHFIVVVYSTSAGHIYVYVDGSSVATVTPPAMGGGPGPQVEFGNVPFASGYSGTVHIYTDSAAYWHSALTSADVNRLWQGSLDQQAQEFEPVLRFDSSERWRPLKIGSFFAEGQHKVCGPYPNCPIIHSVTDLSLYDTPSSFIDIAGRYNQNFDPSVYHSPYSQCVQGQLLDCDTGSNTAIYYRRTSPYCYPPDSNGQTTCYPYIDYWFFYRYNDGGPTGTDQHEGDWEGVTVAPSLTNPATFDFAALSQHGTFYAYLRDNLACQEGPQANPPNTGTCGTESGKSGRKLAIMVANGSHANYPKWCSEQLPSSCMQQPTSPVPGNFEAGGYDGHYEWGRTWTTSGLPDWSALLKMPALASGSHPVTQSQWEGGPRSWSDWPGKWGNQLDATADGPESPGDQPVTIMCSQLDNTGGCPNPGPRSATSVVKRSLRAPIGARCDDWIGMGVAAVVCDPTELAAAVRRGRLGRSAALRVTASSARRFRPAGGRGISQQMGPMLRTGSAISVYASKRRALVLILRALSPTRRSIVIARFRLPSSAVGVVAASKRGSIARLRLSFRRRAGKSQPYLRMRMGRAVSAAHVSTVRFSPNPPIRTVRRR